LDKETVLREIRRTAAENDGVPLGRDRFKAATGIRPGDWEGRHWARWSDAVREAGLNPNLLNASFDREFVLEQYVSLVRKLGRVPVRNELRMESITTPGFPNDKTFRTHLGVKADQVAKVRAYCQERGYSDVLQLLPDRNAERSGPSRRLAEGVPIGSVYLLKSGRHYKIGRSNAVGRREYEIGLRLPEKGVLVHEIRTDDPEGIEAYWHKRFGARRGNGEWFDLTPEDVSSFRRRTFM